MPVRTVIEEGRVPVKAYTADIEAGARQQLVNLSKLAIVHHHVAAMPDVHAGIGATVGSVIATDRAIVPAAVGVDIGCGMIAARTSLDARHLDEEALKKVFHQVSRDVPVGREQHPESRSLVAAARPFKKGLDRILEKHPQLEKRFPRTQNWVRQLGTLGGGNHFIEVCLDEQNAVWVMLHSGSRGIGNAIGTYFIELARRDMERQSQDLSAQTAGVICRKDRGVVDEIPAAYKPIEEVMSNQSDLVDIIHTLKQVICVKG